jgi:hypothetical protein
VSYRPPLWDYIFIWRVPPSSGRTLILSLRPCILSGGAAVSLVRYNPQFVRSSTSTTAVYLDVRLEWAVTTMQRRAVIVAVFVMVMGLLS